MKIEERFKGFFLPISSIIPAGIFYITEAEYAAMFILICLYLLDIITGLIKSKFLKIPITSKSATRKTLPKGILYMFALIVFYLGSRLPIPLVDFSFVYIVSVIAMIELYSNLENLACMGLDLPQKIINKINNKIICDDCNIK